MFVKALTMRTFLIHGPVKWQWVCVHCTTAVAVTVTLAVAAVANALVQLAVHRQITKHEGNMNQTFYYVTQLLNIVIIIIIVVVIIELNYC
jgi:hypothetical protein